MAHTWPGNVRELRNVLERAMVVASGRVIEASDLGLRRPPCIDGVRRRSPRSRTSRSITSAACCTKSRGNISQAARTLGIDRATLYNKIRKYQLRKDGEPELEETRRTD